MEVFHCWDGLCWGAVDQQGSLQEGAKRSREAPAVLGGGGATATGQKQQFIVFLF